MAMLLHVRAEPRRAAFELHLTDEAALHERIEAVINRRVGNLRHRLFCADENFLRRRMIALVHDHVVDMLALRREAEAARAQPFGQVMPCFAGCGCAHYEGEV